MFRFCSQFNEKLKEKIISRFGFVAYIIWVFTSTRRIIFDGHNGQLLVSFIKTILWISFVRYLLPPSLTSLCRWAGLHESRTGHRIFHPHPQETWGGQCDVWMKVKSKIWKWKWASFCCCFLPFHLNSKLHGLKFCHMKIKKFRKVTVVWLYKMSKKVKVNVTILLLVEWYQGLKVKVWENSFMNESGYV